MIKVLGIDVGATYTKATVMDEERTIVARSMVKTGFNLAGAAEKAFNEVISTAGLTSDDIDYVASTGYGRYLVPMRDLQITELTCHAKGAAYAFPQTRTVLDAGGQTVKAIKVNERGKVRSFRLNDKCAAGTGAFLDKTARYMGFDDDVAGDLALSSTAPVTISSVCAVFAESEVINHLTAGEKPEDIMYGAVLSLASRAVQLMKRVGMEPEVTFVGGMSRNTAFARALAAELGGVVNVPEGEQGQFNGSLGACLLALDRVHKLQAGGQWQARSRVKEHALR
jgi:(R)-2-hydroxyacyl-CoA dehydratese activating ATPase